MSRQDAPPTVIGVMPPGVRFLPSPTNSQEPNYNVNALVDFWIPAAPDPSRVEKSRTGTWWGGWATGATLQAGASGTHRRCSQARRRDEHDFAGIAPQVRLADLRIESRRPPHSAAAVGRGRAGASHRVRQCGGPAAGARTATAAGICSAQRAGRRRIGAVPAVATESLLLALCGRGAWRWAWRSGW